MVFKIATLGIYNYIMSIIFSLNFKYLCANSLFEVFTAYINFLSFSLFFSTPYFIKKKKKIQPPFWNEFGMFTFCWVYHWKRSTPKVGFFFLHNRQYTTKQYNIKIKWCDSHKKIKFLHLVLNISWQIIVNK